MFELYLTAKPVGFEELSSRAVARLLREAAERVEEGELAGTLTLPEGAAVGVYSYESV